MPFNTTYARDVHCVIASLFKSSAHEYGMKFNIKRTKTTRVSREPGTPLGVQVGAKEIEEVQQFKYLEFGLESTLTQDMKCQKEIRTRMANGKSSLCREQNTPNTRFKQRNEKENRQNDNLVSCMGAKKWTIRKENIGIRKSLKHLKCGCGGEWKRPARMMDTISRRQKQWIGHTL